MINLVQAIQALKIILDTCDDVSVQQSLSSDLKKLERKMKSNFTVHDNEDGGTIYLIDKESDTEIAEIEYIVEDDHIYLEYIRVWDQESRGKGYAKVIYDEFENHIRKYNKNLIVLQPTPLDDDITQIGLIRLYERFGFKVTHDQGHVVMSKHLK